MNPQTEPLTPRQEIDRLEFLAKEITDLRPEDPVYAWARGSTAITVTVFKEGRVDWQQNLFDWSCDEAYLPKLRFVRNELEQMYQEALEKRQKAAA